LIFKCDSDSGVGHGGKNQIYPEIGHSPI
jgi:hypothetical protein